MSYFTERRAVSSVGRRARRGARGAVMVEGVIVVMVLAIAFVSVVFLGGLYKAKLLAMHDARALNMFNATNSCEPKGFSAATDVPDASDPPSLPQEALGLGVDLAHDILQGGGVSRTTSKGSFAFGPPRPPKGDPKPLAPHYTGAVSATSYTLCNEKRLGVNFKDLVVHEFTLLKQTLGADFGSLISDLF